MANSEVWSIPGLHFPVEPGLESWQDSYELFRNRVSLQYKEFKSGTSAFSPLDLHNLESQIHIDGEFELSFDTIESRFDLSVSDPIIETAQDCHSELHEKLYPYNPQQGILINDQVTTAEEASPKQELVSESRSRKGLFKKKFGMPRTKPTQDLLPMENHTEVTGDSEPKPEELEIHIQPEAEEPSHLSLDQHPATLIASIDVDHISQPLAPPLDRPSAPPATEPTPSPSTATLQHLTTALSTHWSTSTPPDLVQLLTGPAPACWLPSVLPPLLSGRPVCCGACPAPAQQLQQQLQQQGQKTQPPPVLQPAVPLRSASVAQGEAALLRLLLAEGTQVQRLAGDWAVRGLGAKSVQPADVLVALMANNYEQALEDVDLEKLGQTLVEEYQNVHFLVKKPTIGERVFQLVQKRVMGPDSRENLTTEETWMAEVLGVIWILETVPRLFAEEHFMLERLIKVLNSLRPADDAVDKPKLSDQDIENLRTFFLIKLSTIMGQFSSELPVDCPMNSKCMWFAFRIFLIKALLPTHKLEIIGPHLKQLNLVSVTLGEDPNTLTNVLISRFVELKAKYSQIRYAIPKSENSEGFTKPVSQQTTKEQNTGMFGFVKKIWGN